jgi:hypothetical protein
MVVQGQLLLLAELIAAEQIAADGMERETLALEHASLCPSRRQVVAATAARQPCCSASWWWCDMALCMCAACVLHVCCMCAACVLHVCYMCAWPSACVLLTSADVALHCEAQLAAHSGQTMRLDVPLQVVYDAAAVRLVADPHALLQQQQGAVGTCRCVCVVSNISDGDRTAGMGCMYMVLCHCWVNQAAWHIHPCCSCRRLAATVVTASH